jgi:hypothetical protein
MEYWLSFGTDQSKSVYTGGKVTIKPMGENGNRQSISGNIGIKPASRLEIQTSPSYTRFFSPYMWVGKADDIYGQRADILGELKGRSFDLVTRWTLLFTNTLSLQFYNQLFFAKGDYNNFFRLLSSFGYSGLDGVDYNGDPDFFRSVCNTSLVLRWEYRPGSTLYAVWSQGIRDNTIPQTDELYQGINNLRSSDKNNTFLLKMNFRFLL